MESVRTYGIFTFARYTISDAIKQDLLQRLTQWKQQQNEKKQVEEDIQKELLQITIHKGLSRANRETLSKALLEEKKQCAGCVE